MNNEFTTAWRGERGIYRGGPKASVGATDPVLNNGHRHWFVVPTGAFAVANFRHWVVA